MNIPKHQWGIPSSNIAPKIVIRFEVKYLNKPRKEYYPNLPSEKDWASRSFDSDFEAIQFAETNIFVYDRDAIISRITSLIEPLFPSK